VKLHDVQQGTPEWLELRLGIPTASEFDSIISPTWKTRTGDGPNTYLCRKIVEKVCGHIDENHGSGFAMEQGSILEHEAVPWFEFEYGVKIQRVGFCTTDDGRVGCSPDGLIGQDGGIEIKCPLPHTHLKYLMAGVLPPDYAAQVHGSMFVTGRSWWHFVSCHRKFPALVLKVERDEKIQAAIGAALTEFNAAFDKQMAKLKKIGGVDDE
jgi:hypothetical protein